MEDNRRKPFNDASDHLTNIEGYPMNAKLSKLPKLLKFFGYFFITFFVLAFVLFIFLAIFY